MEILYEILIPALAAVVTGLASWAVAVLVKWLNSKINNETLKTVLEQTQGIITAAVAEVSQIFVDELKKTGSFDEAAKKEAYEMALSRVRAQLTEAAAGLIKATYGDLDAWLKMQIEKAVRETKTEGVKNG